jgi:tetratricopeptide (TPR) repeat protein
MRTSGRVLITLAILCVTPCGWAAGGGAASAPQPRIVEQTPRERAKSAYNTGVRAIRKADALAAESTRTADGAKKDKSARRALEAYGKALAKFEDAVRDAPDMHEAWNYIGYAKRKLGELPAALAAYDRALALKPGYPNAIEYRGQAYLALNRLEDAKQAYLELYAGNRALSDQLLAAMRDWIGAQRATASMQDPAALEEFDRWVQERTSIAAQTAALTREGASWN